MWPEKGREKIEVGQEEFALIDFGASEQAAAVVEQVEHGEEAVDGGEPAVRGGVELPQLADAGALPAAHGRQNSFGRDGVGQLLLDGPAADLGAVEFEGVEPEGLEAAKL